MFDNRAAVRNLLLNLVRRDLGVRYKSTVLGFFWSFLKPLALTGIFYLVFDKILEIPLREKQIPFALHLLTGILAWTFFAGAANDAMQSVLANSNLIKKVKLPLAVFPLAAVCSQLIHFLLALLVLIALLVWQGLPPGPAFLLMPLVVALQFLLAVAVGLMLSALNVFYRDVSSIWEVLTTAWFYGTPIIYPVYEATEKMHKMGWGWMEWLYLANPMTPIVLAYRRLMLYGALDAPMTELPDRTLLLSLALSLGLTLFLLGLSQVIFRYFAKKFADEL